MKKLKVFSCRPNGTYEVVCACNSMKQFSEIVRLPYSYLLKYESETKNEQKVLAAMKKPYKLVIVKW